MEESAGLLADRLFKSHVLRHSRALGWFGQFISEYGPTLYHGKIRATQSGSASLRLPEGLGDGFRKKIQSFPVEQELYAFVVAGTGFGQFQSTLRQRTGILN